MSRWEDIRKTIDYARRNGIGAAYAAVRERLAQEKSSYTYEPPTADILKEQRAFYSRRVMEAKGKRLLKFSVLTPAYLTDKQQLARMIASVKQQTYGEWELIIADASPQEKRLEYAVTDAARDSRVKYVRLRVNGGIAENTNAALSHATGEYIVLLDHDDLMTADALYELERAITGGNRPDAAQYAKRGCALVYSDEDKFTEEAANGKETALRYFDAHFKPDFDFERFLSNNYICHLTAVRTDVAVKLRFRRDFDGAQDYDFFLRVVDYAMAHAPDPEVFDESAVPLIRHVPKVLYHWRSHARSTATNPASKRYAYDAGKRALEDFMRNLLADTARQGTAGAEVQADGVSLSIGAAQEVHFAVEELKHLGFYRIRYLPDVFAARSDIGVVGGKLLNREGAIAGGRMDAHGNVFYEGTPKGQSGGRQHPAVLMQDAYAVDIRCMRVRKELIPLYQRMCMETDGADAADEAHCRMRGVRFCEAVRAQGFRIIWDPQMEACLL